MPDMHLALGGYGKDVFAGVAVSDFKRSLDWYRRLLGGDPAFFPNDSEAVWSIGDKRWLYIIVDAKRAGGGIQTIMCSDFDQVLAGIASRGLAYDDEERPAGNVRKVIYHDPDGNEIGIGTIPAG